MDLMKRINSRLTDHETFDCIDNMVETTTSINKFNSPGELRNHLMEGALLNVTALASKAISVPSGEYMVWMTDAGHTMLVPMDREPNNIEVFENSNRGYDIITNKIIRNWNKFEKTLSEDTPNKDDEEDKEEDDKGNDEDDDSERIPDTVDMSTVDRPSIANTIYDKGYTITSFANAVGVDTPAISRLLRTPKATKGDPGGRNPSMDLASKICDRLNLDPASAFPDIFRRRSKSKPRKRGNRGSGNREQSSRSSGE